MKVLLVTHGVKDPRTAVYRNTLNRAEFLRQLGHDVQVLTPFDAGVSHGRLMPLVYPFAVAAHLLRREAFDVVVFHSHTGWVYQLLRGLWRRHRSTRIAVAFHGVDVMYVKALEEELARQNRKLTFRFRLVHAHVLPALCAWSCRRADRVFCLNSAEQSFLLGNRWTTPACLRTMPHCIHLSEFAPKRSKAAHGIHLLTIAQWLPIKGTRYLVEAFTTLVRAGSDITLTCAGTGKPADEVLGDFPEDVRARVAVVPSFDRTQIDGLFQNTDIFVLASVHEPFGMVILEALAAGVAIVATDTGGPKDILSAEESALMVPVADAAALSAAFRRLLDDAGLRDRLGHGARRKAQSFLCDQIMPMFAADLLGEKTVAEVRVG